MNLNGIDISHHQNGLNLNKVKCDSNNVKCDFVIIKATQGTSFVDPCWKEFATQAKESHKLYGFYHYATGSDPIAESNYFIKNIKGYVGKAILALDFEEKDNKAWNSNPNGWIKKFCDNVAKQTGVKPLVYIQFSALNKVKNIGDYDLWVARYRDNNPVIGFQQHPWKEGEFKCAIRQYTSHGRLPEYKGDLDFDKFYGDATAWHKYANPKKFK